jgi:hypothetical protein
VTQVVGGHLALEALRGEQERSAHDAGVSDQGGEVVVAVEQRLGAAWLLECEIAWTEHDDKASARAHEQQLLTEFVPPLKSKGSAATLSECRVADSTGTFAVDGTQ